ncbi:MAG TPA: hypothetical protein VEL47_01045 [Myxococcota bacterium]|nr:hypothetical protein [Myxococcota bacterium]
MIRRLKSTWPSSRFLLVVMSFGNLLLAEAERASIKMGGNFGRAHCKSEQPVEIELPQKALQEASDFRYKMVNAKEKADKTTGKPESNCDPSLADGTETMGKFTKEEPKIPAGKFLSDNACSQKGGGASGQRMLCIYEGDGGKDLVAYALFSFNTKLAKIDQIDEISALNGEISFVVVYSNAAGAVTIETCYSEGDSVKIKEDGSCGAEIERSSSQKVTISGLKDNTNYSFVVRLKDENNEPTKWSETKHGNPVRGGYPLNSYDGAGPLIGCQQSNGSSTMFLLLVLAAWLTLIKLRSKKTWPTNAMVLLMGLSFMDSLESRAELAQMNVGLLGAMYRPDLDSEKLSSGENIFPFYKCYFRRDPKDKEGPINPLLGAEFDWHLWDGFGSLQLGFGVGYTFKTGQAVKLDANGRPDCGEPIPNTKAALHMYQIRPQLTYIFNPYAEDFPLVPYVRAALIGHGYIFTPGKKSDVTNASGVANKSVGFGFGYQAAVGLMLMMDFLEPSAVKSAYSGGLFQHVYLKGELSYTSIDNFGRRGLVFSAKDVMGTGLPLMWTFGLVFELP